MGLTRSGTLCGLLVALALFQTLHAVEDLYSNGTLDVALFTVPDAPRILPWYPKRYPKCKNTGPSPAGQKPPWALFIAVPQASGQYPVIHLQHGFTMKTSYYSQVMYHLASHGFIVIAPQMNQISGKDATGEIAAAAAVLDWYPNNLVAKLGELVPSLTVVPDLNKVALVGHSRGGKVAFGLAKGECKSSVKYSAVAGFDPVDGTGPGQQTPPKILPNKPGGLNLTFPTLVVGAGLGPQAKCESWACKKLFPPCAPLGVSHAAFFEDSAALAFHFVAPQYGHMDYLDDSTDGFFGWLSYGSCKNGPAPSRGPMRRFSGGILIAFLEAVFSQNYTAISDVYHNPSQAPLQLEKPQMKGQLPVGTSSSDSETRLITLDFASEVANMANLVHSL